MSFLKVGPEILVNTNTLSDQYFPSVTALSDGRYVVVWRTNDVTADGDGSAIKAQILNADGSKQGPEFLVNERAYGSASRPEVTALANGGFVVAFRADVNPANPLGTDTDPYAIGGRVFSVAADGTATGGTEFLMNTIVSDTQNFPAIATLANGGFVATWRDESGAVDDEVRAQVFDAAGNKLGLEILVNTTTMANQYEPRIAAAGEGFVVTWTDFSSGDNEIRMQRFDAAGNKLGVETLVNTTTTNDQEEPDVAGWANGKFVIAWTDNNPGIDDTSAASVRAQIFNADGTKSGVELLVNSTTLNNQEFARVVALPDGRFVICWVDSSLLGGDASSTSVKAQVFAADGSKLGVEFLVNTTTAMSQEDIQVTATSDGKVMFAWEDNSAGNSDIRAQIFDINAATGTAGLDIFAIGGGMNSIDGGAGTDIVKINLTYNEVKRRATWCSPARSPARSSRRRSSMSRSSSSSMA
jgi:hypothetical protein